MTCSSFSCVVVFAASPFKEARTVPSVGAAVSRRWVEALRRALSALAVGILLLGAAASAQELPATAEEDLERRALSALEPYAELEGVEVEAQGGRVTLSGVVVSAADRERAEEVVGGLEGVVAVENRIEQIQDVRDRLRPVARRFEGYAYDILFALPLFAAAALVLLLTWWAAVWVGRWERPFRRLSANRFLSDLLRQLGRVAVLLVGVLLALEILDATALVGAVLGAAGVAGLAVGFAFKDLVENYIASVLLSLRQPFGPGDLVDIDGREGKVIRLTSRATILRTMDGNHLRIPNAQVFKGVILNYDRNPRRRLCFEVSVASGRDVDRALDVGVASLAGMPGILGDPPPACHLTAVGDWATELTFYAWIDQREVEFLKVRSEAIRLVLQALQAAGIDLPEPTYRVLTRRAEEESARAPLPSPPSPRDVADLSVDEHLDAEIEAERTETEGRDLLDVGAPQE